MASTSPTTQVPALGTAAGVQVPEAVAQAVRVEVARRTGVDPTAVRIQWAEQVEWPDTSLGCPQPGQMYAQVITPGYRVNVQAGERTLELHTDMRGRVVQCG